MAGVDEVGRGAFAGPIVAAAVMLRQADARRLIHQPWFAKVRDSKTLSPATRLDVFSGFIKYSNAWAVAQVSNLSIDSSGIGAANRRVVELAVAGLSERPDFVLVDYVAGLSAEVAGRPARTIVGGDARVFSVALASIVAKVYRDRLMIRLDKKYPGYGFAEHKGYGTPQHRAALARLGPCEVHRHSYRPVAATLL